MSEESDDQSPGDLSLTATEYVNVSKVRIVSLPKKASERRRQPPGYTPRRVRAVSEIPMTDSNLRFMEHQSRHLVGTRHHDDD